MEQHYIYSNYSNYKQQQRQPLVSRVVETFDNIQLSISNAADKCSDYISWFLEMLIANIFSWRPGCVFRTLTAYDLFDLIGP